MKKPKITKMQIFRTQMNDKQFNCVMDLIGKCMKDGGSVDYVEKTVSHPDDVLRTNKRTLVRTDIEIRWKR